MTSRALGTVARIAVLLVLVLGATWGGSREIRDYADPVETAQVTGVPTEVAIIDPPVKEDPSPTVAVTEVSAPTQIPTAPPTPEPTALPAGRGEFPAPENTTGSSIVVGRGPTDTRTVALTFDAGEGRGYTEEILDLLKREGIRASFGTTAAWARENPDLILRILDEGHLLFNHSVTHASWTGNSTQAEPLTEEQRRSEVTGAEDAVMEIADYDMAPYWRPPYGDYDAEGQVLLASMGYDYTLFWSCDTLAWSGITAQEIVEKCGPNTDDGGPGAIILFHVAQEQDYLSLEQMIAEYKAEGYEFVPVNEMIPN